MADGMQNVTTTSEIAKSICEVMLAVKRVPKNGRNKFHGYDYATESDLLSVIRPAMAEAGLILLPSQEEATPPDECGNVRVRVEYTLAHISGEIWPKALVSYGVGNDRAKNGNDGDKAIYKAVTGANKYMLFKLFQVDTGDDPEAEEISNEDRTRRAAPQQAPTRKSKADSRDDYKRLQDSLRKTGSREEQVTWWNDNKLAVRAMAKDFEDMLVIEMRERAEDFDHDEVMQAAE